VDRGLSEADQGSWLTARFSTAQWSSGRRIPSPALR